MKTEQTKAIVLSRINYGESDRIITVLTLDFGKLRLIVKGARKVKSKMAGGIELFSTIEISFIKGKGEIDTLVSARLENHYGKIINDIKRVQLAYDILRSINRHTEDNYDEVYYSLLNVSLTLLDDNNINGDLIKLWFDAQLLSISGHIPNLITDESGQLLDQTKNYFFDHQKMCFSENENGKFNKNHIKFMRLIFEDEIIKPKVFNVVNSDSIQKQVKPLVDAMFKEYISL